MVGKMEFLIVDIGLEKSLGIWNLPPTVA